MEKNAYILGTEQAELHRLGLQHQVWAEEARKAWTTAEFGTGQTILDLGCGPGFCTRELAYMVGNEGRVIGVDLSETYTKFLREINRLHGLNMEIQNCDFSEMVLEPESLDGVYCRWALAWLSDPETVIERVKKAMKPGAAFAVHEYYDWSMFQTEPANPALDKGIAAALQSFYDSPGNINIGRSLPMIFNNLGMEVISMRPMTKLMTPDDLTWQWPKTFLSIYLPKLVKQGYLTDLEVQEANDAMEELEWVNGATCLCPQMIEVIAVKL